MVNSFERPFTFLNVQDKTGETNRYNVELMLNVFVLN